MSSFFDDIIAPNTISNMKHLGDNFDSFNLGIRQMLNFQFMLFDALNELAAKFVSLKTEVSFLGNQLLNVDDAVSTYLASHPVEVYTRDGVPIDDAISILQDRLNATSERLNLINEKTEKYDIIMSDSVSKDVINNINMELERTTETSNETSMAVQMIQRELTKQKDQDDNKWDVVRNMFKQQVEQYGTVIDSKVESSDLVDYVKHSELAELMALFRSVPDDIKTKIPDILPQIFKLKGLSMDEKLTRAYDLLNIERKRIDTENQQLNDAFNQLKEAANANSAYAETEHDTDFVECEVRDIATDSGYVEFEDERTAKIKRFAQRSTIATNFDGPDNAIAEAETGITDLLDQIDTNGGEGFSGKVNTKEIVSHVLNRCQGIIERQLELLFNALGVKIDKNDIVTLVHQLSIVEALQREFEAIKIKLPLKVDQSVFYDELRRYMLKEEFYEKYGGEFGPFSADRSNLPKVTSRSIQKRAKTDQRNRPVPLVPARNPYMLGVNDKYMKGKDNKLYLRETTVVGDKSYKEPPVTGSNRSYFERSKMSMELDGIEAVVDFQPFVPVDEVKRSGSTIIQAEPYQFGANK
ncbi:hypothetical protein TRFO_06005 [Tritrichomonas foetus]|uniref:Uncharacterized protein n=1 Tax=Tritrichomonas foetus TaxID=1144522 RepID=A0A1J4K1C0_9EUKA|nr:hypothetical protein TRFO_06005 [Tritrichomonas foetus]|eukprot:OHT05035.1 hypothetical protein TRFO_06005 [Tritrichomonas foetus]